MNWNYGFIVADDYEGDIFVHFNDLEKAGLTLTSIKKAESIHLSFDLVKYGTGGEEN